MTATLERGEWSAARPGRTLPLGRTRYPFYGRMGGSQGRFGLAENIVPTGIRSRTIKPVAQSLYRLSYRPIYTNGGIIICCLLQIVSLPIGSLFCKHFKHCIVEPRPPYLICTIIVNCFIAVRCNSIGVSSLRMAVAPNL